MALVVSNDNKEVLLRLLGEQGTSVFFEHADLDYLLQVSATINEAASSGWLMKADRLIALYPLSSVALGSESYKFQSISEILSYCNERSRHYTKLAGAASGLILSLQPATSEAE